MKLKRIASAFLAGALALSLAACGGSASTSAAASASGSAAGSASAAAGSDLDYIKGKGKMVIGYTVYEPMNYTDADGNFTGFDTELATAVCAKLGVEPEFVEINWDTKVVELDAKSIDCIWNGMTLTEDIIANCSDPYVINAQVVVMKSDVVGNYDSVDSLKELTFAVESGSAGEAALKDIGITDYVAVQDQGAAVLEVAAGTSDACVIDITMANAMTGPGTSYADLSAGISLTEEEYGVGFRKDSDLTAKFNEVMKKLMADGTLDALAEKYNLTLVK